VAIAASLGGPRALSQMLSMLPRELSAPVCICQHISEGFTQGLAQWLSAETGHGVEEAREGELLEPGTIYVAPSLYHFRVMNQGRVALDPGPPIQGFRPSCDALLESVANAFGRRAIGVILTGMGRDGASGLRMIRENGGRTIAQDEASCVVWGMPGEAVELGAAQTVLPLEKIASTLVKWVDEC
jgi:two-component system chemotaxis response regulator CheB